MPSIEPVGGPRRQWRPALATVLALTAIATAACGTKGQPDVRDRDAAVEPSPEASVPFENPFGFELPGQEGPAMERVEVVLEDIVPNVATFGGYRWAVTGARIINVAPYGMFSEPVPDEQLFAYVDLAISPLAIEEGASPSFDDLTLQLYTGQQMPRFPPPGVDDPEPVAGTDELTYQVWFPVDEVQALDGAALRLGHPDDAPALLPLTRPLPDLIADPVQLDVAGSATGPGNGFGNAVSWTLVGGEISRDRPPYSCCPETGDRAGPEETFLTLSLEATLQPGTTQGFDYAVPDDVRVVVDGQVYEAFDGVGGGSIKDGETIEVEAHFVIPAYRTRFAVEVGRVGSETGQIEVDLRAPEGTSQ